VPYFFVYFSRLAGADRANGFSGLISGFLQIFLEICKNFCYDKFDLHQLELVQLL